MESLFDKYLRKPDYILKTREEVSKAELWTIVIWVHELGGGAFIHPHLESLHLLICQWWKRWRRHAAPRDLVVNRLGIALTFSYLVKLKRHIMGGHLVRAGAPRIPVFALKFLL